MAWPPWSGKGSANQRGPILACARNRTHAQRVRPVRFVGNIVTILHCVLGVACAFQFWGCAAQAVLCVDGAAIRRPYDECLLRVCRYPPRMAATAAAAAAVPNRMGRYHQART